MQPIECCAEMRLSLVSLYAKLEKYWGFIYANRFRLYRCRPTLLKFTKDKVYDDKFLYQHITPSDAVYALAKIVPMYELQSNRSISYRFFYLDSFQAYSSVLYIDPLLGHLSGTK